MDIRGMKHNIILALIATALLVAIFLLHDSREELNTYKKWIKEEQTDNLKLRVELRKNKQQFADKQEALDRTKVAYDQLNNRYTFLRKEYSRIVQSIQTIRQELQRTQNTLEDIQSKAPTGFKVVQRLRGFEATWYNYNSGRTFTGIPPKDGRTVAVDPDVIPLGSWLRIEFPDGDTYLRKAEDIGSAVQGGVVDIYSTASTPELMKRGRTHGVRVYLLERTG